MRKYEVKIKSMANAKPDFSNIAKTYVQQTDLFFFLLIDLPCKFLLKIHMKADL